MKLAAVVLLALSAPSAYASVVIDWGSPDTGTWGVLEMADGYRPGHASLSQFIELQVNEPVTIELDAERSFVGRQIGYADHCAVDPYCTTMGSDDLFTYVEPLGHNGTGVQTIDAGALLWFIQDPYHHAAPYVGRDEYYIDAGYKPGGHHGVSEPSALMLALLAILCASVITWRRHGH